MTPGPTLYLRKFIRDTSTIEIKKVVERDVSKAWPERFKNHFIRDRFIFISYQVSHLSASTLLTTLKIHIFVIERSDSFDVRDLIKRGTIHVLAITLNTTDCTQAWQRQLRQRLLSRETRHQS